MNSIASPNDNLSYRHFSAAAQNIAAAEFALHGFDVLHQAGRTFYWYDLSVASTTGMMKILVHGSPNGLWDLVDPYLVETTKPRSSDFHRAIDLWLERYRHITCCLVHFDLSNLISMPRIYLASAAEVAEMLHESVKSLGEMALRVGSGRSNACWEESLPRRWQFSQARIRELISAPEGKKQMNPRISEAGCCREVAASYPAKCLECLPMMN